MKQFVSWPKMIKTRTITWTQNKYCDAICTLSTFVKQLERGKLESRAIASPGMHSRLYIKLMESLSAEILKGLPFNAIGKSTIDKMSDIESTCSKGNVRSTYICDKSKWNKNINIPSGTLILEIFGKESLPASLHS